MPKKLLEQINKKKQDHTTPVLFSTVSGICLRHLDSQKPDKSLKSSKIPNINQQECWTTSPRYKFEFCDLKEKQEVNHEAETVLSNLAASRNSVQAAAHTKRDFHVFGIGDDNLVEAPKDKKTGKVVRFATLAVDESTKMKFTNY